MSVIQDISVEKIDIANGVILKLTNHGDVAAEFVECYVFFFRDNKLVYVNSNYFTDDDYEIKPGETISGQIDSYEPFDHIEFYLDGRSYKW